MTDRLEPHDIWRAASDLAPEVAARAEETASLRRLPLDLVAKLRAAGLFRMSMPRARGGPEMAPRQQLEVIELLSAADPSVGWCVKVGADGGYLSAFLVDRAAGELYPRLDCVTAGDLINQGRARCVSGGFRVSGRWSFASGCTHADVFAARCRVSDADGSEAETRIVMVPAGRWQILDTWYTTGLAGSGSHDVTAHDLFVPARHTFSLGDSPRRSEPLYAMAAMHSATLSGVPLGLARAAIDAVRAMCREVPAHVADAGVRPLLARAREEMARAEAMLGAARAYTCQTLDALWQRLGARQTLPEQLRDDLELSRLHAFRVSREVAQQMFDLSGANAVYSKSPLDRLLRDAITISQHVVARPNGLESISRALYQEMSIR